MRLRRIEIRKQAFFTTKAITEDFALFKRKTYKRTTVPISFMDVGDEGFHRPYK